MKKPDQLRAIITAAIPSLAVETEGLVIFIDEGKIACTGVQAGTALSFQYAYTLSAYLLNFTGDESVLMLAVLTFLQRYQPEVLQSHDSNAEAISFQAEQLNDTAVDLEFKLRLTERVRVTPRAGQPGQYDYQVLDEPVIGEPNWTAQHWQIFAGGERVGDQVVGGELIGEWDVPA